MTPAFTGQEKELSREECDEHLREQGTGVLSLASDDEAYSVPISFGYADDVVYFVFLGYAADSEKGRFAETTDRACLVSYDVSGKFGWESVVVRGPLREVDDDEWDDLVDAIEDNAWYPSLFSEADPQSQIRGFALSTEDVSGLADQRGT